MEVQDQIDITAESEEVVAIVEDIVVTGPKKRGRKKKIVGPKIPKKRGRKKIVDRKPLVCGLCGRISTSTTKLIIHMRTHTGEKPFACTYCDAKYSRKDKLTIHLRSHTGDKPYECPVCQKKFSIKAKLTNHEKIHTGEKPYHCEVENCGAKFSLRDKLVRHLRVHSGEKPYNCQFCDKNFTRKDKLNVHVRTAHPSEAPPVATVVKKVVSAPQRHVTKETTSTSPLKSASPSKSKLPLKSTTKENEQFDGAVIRRNPSRLSKINHKVTKMKSDVDPLSDGHPFMDDPLEHDPDAEEEEEGSEFEEDSDSEESSYGALHGDSDFEVAESSNTRQKTRPNSTPSTTLVRRNTNGLEKEWQRSQELCKMFRNMRKNIAAPSFPSSKGTQVKCHVCKMFFAKEIILAQHLIKCH